ncbi:hypothetical protein CYMTET_52476 [Cymbomonas tetramitiformis]|uniref:Uncharacterized protein n=1 Tax=Cymbomonas tetramitiformis TaxID=36881 RepID=A0AAE0BJ76_9CHLO|nr:hypothetical protein CYMTET_52476 [Cymbomonas tetramitiformis]
MYSPRWSPRWSDGLAVSPGSSTSSSRTEENRTSVLTGIPESMWNAITNDFKISLAQSLERIKDAGQHAPKTDCPSASARPRDGVHAQGRGDAEELIAPQTPDSIVVPEPSMWASSTQQTTPGQAMERDVSLGNSISVLVERSRAAKDTSQYQWLLIYLLFFFLHLIVLYFLTSTGGQSSVVVDTINNVLDVSSFYQLDSIYDWVADLVGHIYTMPICGNFLCEEPYEIASFGRGLARMTSTAGVQHLTTDLARSVITDGISLLAH